MKPLLAVGLLAGALLALVPVAQAQQVPNDAMLTVTAPTTPIPYMGSIDVPFTLRVGCLALAPTATVTVGVASPPAWLTVTPFSADVNPSTCAGTADGYTDIPGTIKLAVSDMAPGVVDNVVNVTASVSGQAATQPAPKPLGFQVAYHVAYTITPDARFPLTVTKPKTTFNVTITQASNQRSMVMIEENRCTVGTLTGIGSEVYESQPGKPASKTYKAAFTAPPGAWQKATCTFTGFGHFLLLDSRAGPFDAGTHESWEFDNGGVQPATHAPTKKSPEPVAAFLALGLAGLAAALRRRE